MSVWTLSWIPAAVCAASCHSGPSASSPSPAFLQEPVKLGTSQEALAKPKPRVLVFSKTAGFRHDSIPDGVAMLKFQCEALGWPMTHTEDAEVFNESLSPRFDVIVFLSTTGNILDESQQLQMERFMAMGGGFVGIHAAADTEYEWAWYGQMMGAYFASHPRIQPATTKIIDRDHPTTSFLRPVWLRTDEWYDYKSQPPASARVLGILDEKSYEGGKMGEKHPIIWAQELAGGGRSWYTGMGHTKESYGEPLFQRQIMEAILWTAQGKPAR